MTNFLQLQSHEFTGTAILSVSTRLTFGTTMVEFSRPFIPLGNGLAITPVVELDANGLHFRLSTWIPMHMGRDGRARLLTLHCATQRDAVAAVHAFDGDPTISWQTSAEDIETWCHRYVARLSNARSEQRG